MTTLFPNEYYNKVGATTTRHIYDNTGGLIASVEGNGIATTTYFIHPDHLGGTNVVTDASGEIVQLIDYYPYGSNRLDTGTDVSQREFIGEMYDEETDLSYLNARYYSGDRGQFNSQDPVFWEVGQTQDGNAILTNPQAQNSYSYAGDNPIVNKDPTGRIIDTLADIGFITYDVYKITQAYIRGESVKEHFAALGLDTAGALIPGVTGLGMMAKVAAKTDNVANNTLVRNAAGELVPVFRGGNVTFNPKDFPTTLVNGTIDPAKTVEGISVNLSEKWAASKNGFATQIESLPKGLQITQQGKNKNHYVIRPARKMTVKKFRSLINRMNSRLRAEN